MVVREQDSLKVQVEDVGTSLAKARKEAAQEYKANLKDINDYLDLFQDATKEYKAQLKKVNSDFDVEHYDRLILALEEAHTPAPEDLVGFNQLDPIGTKRNAAGPSATGADVEASTSYVIVQPADK